MKKIITKSKIAQLLINCKIITLFGFINAKKNSMCQKDVNHEVTHVDQWAELTIAGYAVVTPFVLFGITWLLLLPPFIFYIWYVLEWLVRLTSSNAYKNICFEQEAYANEDDNCYNENRDYFAFLKYLKSKKI